MSAADCVAVLEPCPFCGGEAEFERVGSSRQSCIVTCTQCGGRHESCDEYEDSGKSWNRRALRREGEPVAWVYRHKPTGTIAAVVGADRSDFFADNPSCERLQPLYAATPSPKGPTTP